MGGDTDMTIQTRTEQKASAIGQHTPGPWTADYLDKNDQRVVRGMHIEICTCWHHSVGSIECEMEANAHLIAAAPDMLAALKAVAADRELMDRACGSYAPTGSGEAQVSSLIHDAIAKATT